MMRTLVILFAFLSIVIGLQAQENQLFSESVFDEIDSQNRYVENLFALADASEQAQNMPLGIKKIIGNIPVTLAVSNVKLGKEYGELSLMAKIQIPKNSKELIFGASNIRISNKGDLIGDVKLTLLKDVPLPIGQVGKVIFKGNMNQQTGSAATRTYVTLDCNGDFKELSIDGEAVLDTATYRRTTPIGNDLAVRASFAISIQNLNDLLVEVSFPEFERNDLPGYKFLLDHAVLDMSDTRNSPAFVFPADYTEKGYFSLPENNLWQGFYVKNFKLTLPDMFNKKDDNRPSTLSATNLIIDENGFTADIVGQNILDLSSGSADGWMFSVNGFHLNFLANHLHGLGFSGQVGVRTSDKDQIIDYEAYMSENIYYIKGSLGKKLETSLFGVAEIQLETSSYLQLAVIDHKFVPTVVLDGDMQLKEDILNIGALKFEQLAFSTRSPYVKVKSLGYSGNSALANFPISISDFKFSLDDNLAEITMDVKVNLMEGKIAADTQVKVSSERKNSGWKIKGIAVERVNLKKVELSGFTLSGSLLLKKNDPAYGNCFGATIEAEFGALSNALKVEVKAIFGYKEFRYWYVEGTAKFYPGIPIAGVVFINGFTGGAYYGMTGTGKSGLDAYAPSENAGLGIKAGILLYVSQENIINAKAVFEMSFFKTGGIHKISFYSQANFLGGGPEIGSEAIFGGMQAKMGNMSEDLSDKPDATTNGSDKAKDVINTFGQDLAIPSHVSGMAAYATMQYDFERKTFDAGFRVLLNVLGVIQGVNPGYDAGSVHLYISPDKWFMKAGTPSHPIGIKVGIGSIALETRAYFMFGIIDETPLPPDKPVLDIFGNVTQDAYTEFFPQLKEGKGVAFGMRMKFDTGNLRFLFLEGRFQAGGGFDILVRDMTGYGCKNYDKPIGINHWYAMGQSFAYLNGKLSARIRIFGINKNITIISAGIAVLLEAQAPNPTWIGGRFAVDLNILGIIKGNMYMKMSIGDKCEIVRLDGAEMAIDFPVISDTYPKENAVNVDIFSNPQVTLALKNDKEIQTTDDEGNIQKFRASLSEFYVTDKNGNRLDATNKWNTAYDVLTLELKDVMPPMQNLKFYAEVKFEEYNNSSRQWVPYLSSSGTPYKEIKNISFKSGDAPDHIPDTNIEYMYPIAGQKNMYQKETNQGYVQLKKGQPYLFIDKFIYKTKIKATGNPLSSDLYYDTGLKRAFYTLPDLLNKKNYKLNFTASPPNVSDKNQTKADAATQTQLYQMNTGDESVELSVEQKLAAKIISEGSLNLFECDFRTSRYNTFAEKMQSVGFTVQDMRYVDEDVRSMFLKSSQTGELFDEVELFGSKYNFNKPLITFETDNTNNYYTLDMYPLMYQSLVNVLNITSDNSVYGVPPFKAMTFYPNYLNIVLSGGSDSQLAKTFPFMYDLPMYYRKQYKELKEKAVNLYIKGTYNSKDKSTLETMIRSTFLFMRQGNYRVTFKYALPAQSSGSEYPLDYTNPLDWRK